MRTRSQGTERNDDRYAPLPPPPPPRPPPLPAGMNPIVRQLKDTSGAVVHPQLQQPAAEPARNLEESVQGSESGPSPVTQHDVAVQTASSDWILSVRLPPLPQNRGSSYPHNSIRVYVNADMIADDLAACLAQAGEFPPEYRIVGLFEESTGVFFSLDHLLSMATTDKRRLERSMYCFRWTPPPLPPKKIPWWHHSEFCIILLFPLFSAVFYYYGETMLGSMAEAIKFLFNSTIQIPLKEMYRHGPWFLGWEGESLPAICARITYHGDHQFWSRNLEECVRIYAAKEEAWLKISRPFVYVLIVVGTVYGIRFLAWEWRRFQYQEPPPTDKDMVDTYRAFQVILRQVRRNLGPLQDNRQERPR